MKGDETMTILHYDIRQVKPEEDPKVQMKEVMKNHKEILRLLKTLSKDVKNLTKLIEETKK